MSQAVITEKNLNEYGEFLISDGLSKLTYERYLHDARVFRDFLGLREISPEILKEFKALQLAKYNAVSVKTLICGVNKYLEFIDCPYRIEHVELPFRNARCAEDVLTKEEYLRILKAIKRTYDERLYLIVETICGTGLKFSELKYLTAEAVNEGKVVLPPDQNVYLSKNLCEDLREYCGNNSIYSGGILLTRCGNLPNRSNISRSIKKACEGTGIDPKKLSTKALRDYYYRNFESFRSEMVDLMDEDWRGLHSDAFAKVNKGSTGFYSHKSPDNA